jgi:hypothetical protein
MQSKKAAKSYPLRSSQLFHLLGKGELERTIGMSWSDSARLLKPRYYREWTTAKGREVQQPLYELEKVHARIATLLSRIETPNYVYSKRRRSYIDNAEQHLGMTPLVKTDVNKFYPSTTWPMVYRLFHERFECAQDIAARLADICCFHQKHLPTGSALSGYVAFFAVQPMFDDIAAICAAHQCEMTLFVDDLTASGPGATKKMLSEIRASVRYFGLKTRGDKSITYAASQAKEVTGAVLIGERLLLPNKQHLKLWRARRDIPSLPLSARPKALQALAGREQQAKQILDRGHQA